MLRERFVLRYLPSYIFQITGEKLFHKTILYCVHTCEIAASLYELAKCGVIKSLRFQRKFIHISCNSNKTGLYCSNKRVYSEFMRNCNGFYFHLWTNFVPLLSKFGPQLLIPTMKDFGEIWILMRIHRESISIRLILSHVSRCVLFYCKNRF